MEDIQRLKDPLGSKKAKTHCQQALTSTTTLTKHRCGTFMWKYATEKEQGHTREQSMHNPTKQISLHL